MSIVELIGLILKVVAEILDLHSKNALSKQKVDAVVELLHQVS